MATYDDNENEARKLLVAIELLLKSDGVWYGPYNSIDLSPDATFETTSNANRYRWKVTLLDEDWQSDVSFATPEAAKQDALDYLMDWKQTLTDKLTGPAERE